MSDVIIDSDSGKFKAGDGQDLNLYHNGTNSFVENETGILYVTNKANTSLILGTNNTTAVTIDNSQNTTFAGDVIVPQKIVHSGDTNNYLSFGTDSLSVYTDGTQYVEFIYGHIYLKTNNKALIGYNSSGSAKELIKIDGSDVVQIAEGSNSAFGGNITQSASGNLRHTITAGGSGEASLVLTANNSTGDSFVRWETNSTTFSMGFDNSDGDKFILSGGSDPHSDSIMNIQSDSSLVTFDKAVNVNNTLVVSPNGAKLSIGASAYDGANDSTSGANGWGSSMDVLQIGHTGVMYIETSNAADRNMYIGNNFYHDGSNHKRIVEDQSSGIQFRAGRISFRVAGSAAVTGNLDAGGGTEKMRLANNGYLHCTNDAMETDQGNYDASAVIAASEHSFENGASSSYVMRFFQTHASNPYGIIVKYSNADVSNTSNHFFVGAEDDSDRFQLRSNGGLANVQSNNADLSDERVKKDITDISSQYNFIKSLKVRNFKYKVDSDDDRIKTGVIAQEVELLDETLIDNTGTYASKYIEEGEDGHTNVKLVYDKDIHFRTIKALQEAISKIETLEAKVETLENN